MKSLQTAAFVMMVALSCISGTDAYNILLMTANMKSHMFYFGQLGKGLVSHGHQVTMALGSTMTISEDLKNSRMKFITYHLTDVPFSEKDESIDLLVSATFNESVLGKVDKLRRFAKIATSESELYLKDETFMKTIKERKFDFMVIDTTILPFYILPYKLSIPFALLGIDCSPWVYRIPHLPSYVPHFATKYSDKMSLKERLWNYIMYISITPLTFLAGGKELITQNVPGRSEVGYIDLMAKADLCFRLRELPVDTVRPRMPDVIDVGGLMGRMSSPLTDEWRTLMENTDSGVIIVSFGSWLDKLPPETATSMVEAFIKLKLTVIWKFKGKQSLVNIPANVHIFSWIPQNDLLGHSNTRLLITHSGSSSILEAVYHGVPMVAFPLALDQAQNAELIKSKGYAKVLDIATFKSQHLYEAIQDIIYDNSFKKLTSKASKVFRSLPKAEDTAAFWINHVIENGSEHLKSQAYKLTWYEYISLDVTVILIIIIWLIIKIAQKSFYWCVCKCKKACEKKKSKSE